MNISSLRRLFAAIFIIISTLASQGQEPVQFTGTLAVGAGATNQAINVAFEHSGTVDQVRVVTQGSEGFDFQNIGDNCKTIFFLRGQSCVVNVAFKPSVPGERRGAIVLLDNNKQPLAIKSLVARASGAIATFVPGRIISVAGNSATFFFSGDGGLATRASLFLPQGVCLDAAGNLYIADTYNNRIRIVNSQTAIISTIAGNGTFGSSGDGGPATSANLNRPSTIVLDPFGNLYIADTGNNVIRVVNASTGIITTAVGLIGQTGYTGDFGLATLATLNAPNGLAFDVNGNLYIADTGNNVIRFVNTSTGVISTVAGNGIGAYRGDGAAATAASLKQPFGVTIDSLGTLYIADQANNAVRLVSTAGIITTMAGNATAGFAGDGGIAAKSFLNAPASTAIDAAGNIYISDSGNNRIRKINPATLIITTIAGSGSVNDNNPATLASLYGPSAIALDGNGNLFIADSAHNRIREVQSNIGVVDFSTTRVNSVTAPTPQTLENDGTATLNISSITAIVNAQVDTATTTCSPSNSVAVLAQCVIGVDFAPAVTGTPTTGSIVLNSDALNANSTLYLQGVVQSTYPATVLLSSSPNPSIVGNGVLFSVQVVNTGGIIATGTVTLLDGTASIATLQLTNGIASTTLSNLAIGSHTITASYGGDANDSSAVSLPINQVVTDVPPNSNTTTTLSSSLNPITVGQVLNLNATVAAVTAGQAIPTGSVVFMEGATSLGRGTLNGGSASIGISTLTAGTHLIRAIFSGSSTYSSSTSPVLTQVVIPLNSGTITSLTSNADPISFGLPLILNSTVSAVTAGQAMPTGTVNFMEGTTLLGAGTLGSGAASFTISTLSVGVHLITAVYNGSSTYATSTSPVLTEILVAAGTGNAAQFALTVSPTTLTMQSGAHATVQVGLTTLANFTDTLSFGCGGLPANSSCTFSQDVFAVTGGVSQTLSVVVDTGNPLGAGPSAELRYPILPKSTAFLAVLPGGAFLTFFLGRDRRRRLGLVVFAVSLSILIILSGCSSSFKVQSTPAGIYTFQIFANGANSGSSYTVPVQLTVTK